MADKKQEDLESMSRDELYEKAKEMNIPGKSDMNKEELLAALKNAGSHKGGSQKDEERGGSQSRSSGSGRSSSSPPGRGSSSQSGHTSSTRGNKP